MKIQNNSEQENIVSEDVLSIFLTTGLQFLTGVYVFLILCVMPLYFTDGYAHIGRDKYAFFYQVTTKIGLLFVILLGCLLGQKIVCRSRKCTGAGAGGEESTEGKEYADSAVPKVLSMTDKFALGYAAAVLLSYFFSPYREGGVYADAWYGTQGWYMGACTQLLLVGVYFAVSRFWKAGKWQWILCLAVTFSVFVLGICNRFGLYPISMGSATPEFISTIGNINWYCSYLVLMQCAGLYYIISYESINKRTNMLLFLWLTGGFGAILTQGSLSGLLTLGSMLLVLYLFSVHSMQRVEAFAKCLICLGAAATFIYVLRLIWGEKYNYPDVVTDFVINTPFAFLLLGTGVGAWVVLRRCRLQKTDCEKSLMRVGIVICGAAGLAMVAYIVLVTANTLKPGCLGGLSAYPLFTFDGAWGSNRGISWTVGWHCFLEQDLWGKVVGIGPDTMVEYVNHDLHPELFEEVKGFFGNFKLTNAHNEWLTMLLNEGIFGLAMYVGLLVSAVWRMMETNMKKSGKTEENGTLVDKEKAKACRILAGICGVAVLAYMINSMFSFQQVMGTVTMFVILGMGEACMREKDTN